MGGDRHLDLPDRRAAETVEQPQVLTMYRPQQATSHSTRPGSSATRSNSNGCWPARQCGALCEGLWGTLAGPRAFGVV